MSNRLKDDLRVTPAPRLDRRATDIDVEKLQNTLDKVVSTINRSARHTEQIPDIKSKVDATGDKVIQIEAKMDAVTDRVTKVEKKAERPHDCYNIDVIAELKDSQREVSQKIETDVQKGILQKAAIETLNKAHSETQADVEDMKKAPRRMFYGLVGIIITILVGAGGAIWFLAELSKDVEFERHERTEGLKRIETQIQSVGTKADNAPIKTALKNLTDEVGESNGHARAYQHLCDGMLPHEKRFMRNTLSKRGKRVPISCL